jgi:hypothetical protein
VIVQNFDEAPDFSGVGARRGALYFVTGRLYNLRH